MEKECLFGCNETVKRELNKRLTHECRYDERLKVKTEESISLSYKRMKDDDFITTE
jgi:hypothetical protein